MTPTPDDLQRDLVADLAHTYQVAFPGWPAAIRRALHAEAEVERLKALVESLAARVHAQSELLEGRAMKALREADGKP